MSGGRGTFDGQHWRAGELTNTLKIRRPIINQRYKAEIEAMYV